MSSRALAELAERFVCAPPLQRSEALKSLVGGLRQAIRENNPDEAATALCAVISPDLDFTTAQSLCRIQSQLRGVQSKCSQKVRFAVLGSFTTKQLIALIELFLFGAGIDAEIYESDYNVFRQEILDPQSALYEFRPQIVYLATSWRDLVSRPNFDADRTELERVVAAEQSEWHSLWETLQQNLGCQVIQNNFVLPPLRSFANHEMRQPGSFNRYLLATNQHLVDTAPPFVTIHDVDHLASMSGRWNWDDPRFVHQAKLPCAPEFLVDYAHSVSSLVGAQLGMAKKCLVLDLDNTLWATL